MTACWSKGRNARYPYYFCAQRGCSESRKSIRRDELEGAFEALLKDLQPTRTLFSAAQSMLRDLWETRLTGAQQRRKDAKAEIAAIERKTGGLMERLLEADNTALITAYETKIQELEEQKLLLKDRIEKSWRPRESFDETFRTACAFLASPWKLWASDRMEDKRMVLKLAFAGKLPYSRKGGFRTAIPALPFKVLAGIQSRECIMVVEGGTSEPVSQVRFPDTRENTAYLPEFEPNLTESKPRSLRFLPFMRAIP